MGRRHDLCGFVLRPSLGLLDATQRASIHLQTLNRFFRIVWHTMPTVLITGWLLIFHYGGFAVVHGRSTSCSFSG